MLSYPRYWLERRRLTGQLRAGYKADDRAVAKAKAGGATSADIHQLSFDAAQESWLIEDQLQQLESRYLCLEAHRYRVPIPSHSDKDLWEESTNIGGWQLTAKGYAILRADIRKEKNELWQWWELRIKVIGLLLTGATGAMGALIGLVAILTK